MLGAKDCQEGLASASPLQELEPAGQSNSSPTTKSPLAALKSHLVICLGDISLTTSQSVGCICQVGGVCLLSAQLSGLIVFSLLLSCPICLQSLELPVCVSPGCSARTHCHLFFPRKPSHGCRAATKARLEAKPAGSPVLSHPSLAQITQFRMMVSLGHLAKGASLDDLIDSCIQSFGELANCPHAEKSITLFFPKKLLCGIAT